MGLIFELGFTQFFLKQWETYDLETRQRIEDKLRLIKQNPFRFEKHESYRFVFKVKLSVEQDYSRLMYVVFWPDSNHITVLGMFDRKAKYKDFKRIFSDLRK